MNEVLEGFNSTIFAYGQTGTGKTYTPMEGECKWSKVIHHHMFLLTFFYFKAAADFASLTLKGVENCHGEQE